MEYLQSLLGGAGNSAFLLRLLIAAVTAAVAMMIWSLLAHLLAWPFRSMASGTRRIFLVVGTAAFLAGLYFGLPQYPGAFHWALIYAGTLAALLLLGLWSNPRWLYLAFYTAWRRHLWFITGFVLLYGTIDAGLRGTPVLAASGALAVLLAIMTVAAIDPRIWAVCAHASSKRWYDAPGKAQVPQAAQMACPSCGLLLRVEAAADKVTGQCDRCQALVQVKVDERGSLYLAEIPRELPADSEAG